MAAAIPAILYYVSLFAVVDLEAAKTNLKGLPRSELPSIRKTLGSGWFLLIPVIALIFLMAQRWSPMKACFVAIVLTVIASQASKGTRMEPKKIFDALGFEPKRIIHMAYTDMASALKDNTVDVVIQTYSVGAPLMVDLASINDCYFIPMDDDTWNKLEALGLGYVRLPIPAKAYRLQDSEVPCQAKGGYMVATERLSDKIVYEVCRSFWDNIDKALAINPKVIGECKETVETTLNVAEPCPMHPGAIRYFKEKGMLR